MATTATTTTHPAAEREAKAEGGGAKLPSTTASTRIVPALELNLRALEDRLSRREPLDVKSVTAFFRSCGRQPDHYALAQRALALLGGVRWTTGTDLNLLMRAISLLPAHPDAVPAGYVLLEAAERKGVVPSVHAFTSLVNVCAKSNNIPEAFHAVERMWKLKVVPDVNIFTSLIQLCTRCKDVNRAFEVLELMRLFDVRPDAFVYTSLINAGAKAGEPERALAVMEMMKTDGVKPSAITYNALISALASKENRDVEALVRLVDEMKSQGLTPSVVTYNTLILACRGPSAHRGGGHDDGDDREEDEAEEERRLERALGLLHDMKREGLTPDVITLHSLVRVAIHDDEGDAGNRTRRRRQKNAEDEDAGAGGGGDARRQRGEAAARQVDRALALIDRLTADFPGLTPNAHLYNGLIALCQLGGRADKATALYRRMREAGLQPTIDTFRSLLSSLDHHNDDQAEAQTAAAKQAMELLEARGLLVSAKVYNVLLGESVRAGDAQRAQEVLREMRRKDVPGDYKTSLLRKEAERLH